MANRKLMEKLANIPLAKPGFNSLDISAPVLVQMNPAGRWENTKPETLNVEPLRAVVQHLVNSKMMSPAQSYCCQCAEEIQKRGTKSNYVPIILMPIYPADECPFDIECEVKNIKEPATKHAKKIVKEAQTMDSDREKDKKKLKKRGFVMQRLTDFDLLSQW